MRIIGKTTGMVAVFIGLAGMNTASASLRCTHHDRVVQQINEAYHTRFKSNCTIPSTKASSSAATILHHRVKH
ncbi:hypothetical protein [Acidiphilium sp.]|uniref:hypothetical protein n=1 Tax=Acidiphilium sp. TaxID=527 RepID=UPI003CFC8A11